MNRLRVFSPLALVVAALVVAGCGSSSSSGNSGSGGSAASSGSSTSAGSSGSSGSGGSTGGGYGYGGGSSTSSSSSSSSAGKVTVTTKSSKFGTILAAGPNQMTVYLYTPDTTGKSNCNDGCASAWPPVKGTATATGGAISSKLGTIKRADGSTQVTYDGHPLYYYAADSSKSDVNGQGSGGIWFVLSPSGAKITKS